MEPVLQVENLGVQLKNKKELRTIVENVNFSVCQGECLGILGESGSGKSMTVKAILGLLENNFFINGSALFEGKNLIGENKEVLRSLRGSRATMVLQNPMVCFDPLYRIYKQMEETFLVHTNWSKKEIKEKSLAIVEQMKIENGEEVLNKYPHQLSGGMLQRIMIGIAIALKPKLLIADEPTTAIDAITQVEILEEFGNIKNNHQTAMIFISHDLGAISQVADRILVMNQGKIVDEGSLEHILYHSTDTYTRLLVEKRSAMMKRYHTCVYGKEGARV